MKKGALSKALQYVKLLKDGSFAGTFFRVRPFKKIPITFREMTFMDKILLVDDICDTGKSIEKIYKFLKLVNSNVEIDILCIYGNKGAEEYLGKYLPEAKLNYLYDNEDRWVTFGTWENDYNICKACIFGKACNRDPENMIHCSLHDKSFHWTHSCADFSLIKTHDIKFMGAGTLG